MLTAKQNALVNFLHSVVVVGGAVYLYVKHRIPSDVLSAVVGTYCGAWSAVGGALKLSGGGIAATPPAPVTPVPSAPPTAVTPLPAAPTPNDTMAATGPAPTGLAAPSAFGAGLGPEHGRPA
ncbi:MAG: hypothetical protein ACRDUW_05015 [Pseudonocardiaceae bacterium]